MKKLICYIFGHLAYTYNSGSNEDPEQSWACLYCQTDLIEGDELWGFNLNYKITKFFYDRQNKVDSDIEIPF